MEKLLDHPDAAKDIDCRPWPVRPASERRQGL